jgi:hypothetical protein
MTTGKSEPNKRMKPTALRAAAYPRRSTALDRPGRVRSRCAWVASRGCLTASAMLVSRRSCH